MEVDGSAAHIFLTSAMIALPSVSFPTKWYFSFTVLGRSNIPKAKPNPHFFGLGLKANRRSSLFLIRTSAQIVLAHCLRSGRKALRSPKHASFLGRVLRV